MKAHTQSGKKPALLGLLVLIAATPLPATYLTCELFPSALAVDPSLTGNSDGNGLLEPVS